MHLYRTNLTSKLIVLLLAIASQISTETAKAMPAPWVLEEQLQSSRRAASLTTTAEVISVTRSLRAELIEGAEAALTEVELRLPSKNKMLSAESVETQSSKSIKVLYFEPYLLRTCKKIKPLQKADIRNLGCNLEIAETPLPGLPPVLIAPKPGSRVRVWLNEAGGNIFQPISSGWGWYEYDENNLDPNPPDKLNSRELFKLRFSGIVEQKNYGCHIDLQCSSTVQGVSVITDEGWYPGFPYEVRASRIDKVEIGGLVAVFCGVRDITKSDEVLTKNKVNLQCSLIGSKEFYLKKLKD